MAFRLAEVMLAKNTFSFSTLCLSAPEGLPLLPPLFFILPPRAARADSTNFISSLLSCSGSCGAGVGSASGNIIGDVAARAGEGKLGDTVGVGGTDRVGSWLEDSGAAAVTVACAAASPS